MASFLLTITPIVILYIAWSDAALWLLLIPLAMTWIGKCVRDGPGFPSLQGGKLIGLERLPIAAIGVVAIFMIAELVEMYFTWM